MITNQTTKRPDKFKQFEQYNIIIIDFRKYKLKEIY